MKKIITLAQSLMQEIERYNKELIEIERVADYRYEENKQLKQKIEQLKEQIEKLNEEKQYETCPYRSTDMGCDYCDYRDRYLKYEVTND